MAEVNVIIDGVILHCDETISNLNIGRGYSIEKKYLSEIPFKNKLTDGDGKLTIDYLGSQLHDENGIYFMCIHKEDNYEVHLPELDSGIKLTNETLMCETQLDDYKRQEMKYLHKVFSLLHLFKKGNVGFVQIFFKHNFTLFGFINNTMKQTDNSISKNVIEDTLFTLSEEEIVKCNNFLADVSDDEFNMIKENIDEFIWGLEQVDIPTGFEQYTTALEMTMLAKGQQGKKEALSKRVAVLLETDSTKIINLYNKMKNFYRYRSESLHEGDGGNITKSELKEMEEIVRRVLIKYLDFCKIAIKNDMSVTWEEIKNSKISTLKSIVTTCIFLGILPQ